MVTLSEHDIDGEYLYLDTKLRVCLPAHQIPDEAAVTMRTGEKVYTLVRKLTLFDQQGNKTVLVSGYFLMHPGTGSIRQIRGDLHLLWFTTPAEINDYIEQNACHQ